MAAKMLSMSTQLAVGSDYQGTKFVTGASRFTRLGRSIRRTYPDIELTSRANEVSHSRDAVVHSNLMARDDCLKVVAAAKEICTRRDLFQLIQRPVHGPERS